MLNTTDALKGLTAQDFAALGMESLAYVAPQMVDGRIQFIIHTADGNAVGMAESRDLAFAAVKQHGLDPVSVH